MKGGPGWWKEAELLKVVRKMAKAGASKTEIAKAVVNKTGMAFDYVMDGIAAKFGDTKFSNGKEKSRIWKKPKLDEALELHGRGVSWAKLGQHFGESAPTVRFRVESWMGRKRRMFADFLMEGKDATDMMKEYDLTPAEFKAYRAEATADKVIHTDGKKFKPADAEKLMDLVEMAASGIRELDRAVLDTDVKIREDLPYIGLWCAGDWHLESCYADLGSLRKHVELVATTPGMYASFCGDAMDNAIPGGPHPSLLNDAVVPVRAARIITGALFKKLQHKLIAVTTGCHIQWSINVDDYNLYDDLTRNMGVTYLGPGGTVNMKFPGGAEYRARFMHKYTGAAGVNKLNCCLNYLSKEDATCDIVQVAHNHISAGAIVDWQGKPRALVRSGSYKNLDSFARLLNVRGQTKAHNPVLILGTREKYMRYEPNVEEAIRTLKTMNAVGRD